MFVGISQCMQPNPLQHVKCPEDCILQFPNLQYCKQRCSKRLMCSKLYGNVSHVFYLFFPLSVPILKQLLWLAVHYRIIFKIYTMTFQALSSTSGHQAHSSKNSTQLRSFSSKTLLHSSGENESGVLCCCTHSEKFVFCQC